VFGVGVCAASPWWLASYLVWADAQALAENVSLQQDETRIYQRRVADLKQQQAQEAKHFTEVSRSTGEAEAVTRALMTSAQVHQLQVSRLSFDALQQPAALRPLSLQYLPAQVHMQGTGKAWLNWWARLPTWAPGAAVSSLDVKAGSAGRVMVELALLLPHDAKPVQESWLLAGVAKLPDGNPFSTDDWEGQQLRHAQQHPSFTTWVEPERHRLREPLEGFARERLRYVGWVSQGKGVQALVQVREDGSSSAKAIARLGDTVYRVGPGGYLGQDWGRVSHVTPEQVHVRELVRDPEGVWSARHVTLPLESGTP
jgi:Tfp pilus assembly protein PilP